jgi:hypothetical protein
MAPQAIEIAQNGLEKRAGWTSGTGDIEYEVGGRNRGAKKLRKSALKSLK